jgi:3-oxoacyl-[acyl-carrier protein] reductase
MTNNKNILLIGASSNVGIEIIDAFLKTGASVIATYCNQPIGIDNDKFTSIKLDLLSCESRTRFVDILEEGECSIHMVIFLAGILPGTSLEEYKENDISRVMDVNFTSQVSLLKRLLPMLTVGSQILMMSSISAERGSYDPVYAASKGAIISFVKSLASWLAPKTRVNALAPSLIEGTSMFNEMKLERREYHRQQSPMKKFISAKDLARIVVDISNPHWSHLNGAVLRLNGGMYV